MPFSSGAFSRRSFLKGAALMTGGAMIPLSYQALAAPTENLIAQQTEFDVLGTGEPSGHIFSYGPNTPPPILRAKQGEPFTFHLKNKLPEPTTIHCHGIRLPNEMDGVPFLTQAALYEDDTFTYFFTPPDAGSFWYHPHCNSLEQIGYGLAGALIVDEKEDPGFDADIPVLMRDWRLRPDGTFLPMYKARQSARGGTYGTIRTSNWIQTPHYDVPAGGLIRVRLIAADVTRLYKIAAPDVEALIIAVDGNPVPEQVPLETMTIAPGQRLELAIRVPDEEGQVTPVISYAGNGPFTVLSLRSTGQSLKRSIKDCPVLPQNPVPEADLKNAVRIPMEFSASAEKAPSNIICGSIGYTFWAINQEAWRGSTADPTKPMLTMKQGQSYVFQMVNRTPQAHPIHMHGMSFRILSSNRRPIQPFVTDTALLLPDERVDVALVADNPGDWLLHCHILEHQKSGMSSFVRVE